MCFSATASFTSAAILIPAGLYCLKKSNEVDKSYWAFAILPLMFGLQQLIEGSVWLALTQGEQSVVQQRALAFLLFSHVYWLGWVAYSSYLTESSVTFRRLFIAIAIFGLIFGCFMYVPLLFNPSWLEVAIVRHSIQYDLIFITDGVISQHVIAMIYASIVLVPLMLSSDRYHRMLGVMIFIAGIFTLVFYGWAFISVWCYFAALISLYIFLVIARSVRHSHTVSVSHP